ncbi:MAG: hypothetical protein K0Q90_1171 [Paenibacillaceae bacterium]|jgi:hypothetical protein|nr:hypothetical protein [Paenibacillaceae bacterium]
MAKGYVFMLVKLETRKLLLPALISGIIYAVLGLVTGVLTLGLSDPDSTHWAARQIYEWTADLMMVSMSCGLGFVFTKDYLSYYRTDAFSRKLAFYRKLPVTDKEIVTARFLVFLATLLPMALCFFALFYLPVRIEQLATGVEFTQAAVMWLGLSLAGGAGFLFLEMGFSGKMYLLLSLVVVVIFLAAIAILNLSGIHLVSGSLSLVRDYGIWPSLAVVAVGAAVAWGTAPLIIRRVASRNLI